MDIETGALQAQETFCDILNIRQSAARAREQGLPVSEYTLRQAIRSGKLPCRIVGRTYLIYWDNLLSWLTCAENSDNNIC